ILHIHSNNLPDRIIGRSFMGPYLDEKPIIWKNDYLPLRPPHSNSRNVHSRFLFHSKSGDGGLLHERQANYLLKELASTILESVRLVVRSSIFGLGLQDF
ncbi:11818_t:CDS:2, partial [Funneliformis geosporum]